MYYTFNKNNFIDLFFAGEQQLHQGKVSAQKTIKIDDKYLVDHRIGNFITDDSDQYIYFTPYFADATETVKYIPMVKELTNYKEADTNTLLVHANCYIFDNFFQDINIKEMISELFPNKFKYINIPELQNRFYAFDYEQYGSMISTFFEDNNFKAREKYFDIAPSHELFLISHNDFSQGFDVLFSILSSLCNYNSEIVICCEDIEQFKFYNELLNYTNITKNGDYYMVEKKDNFDESVTLDIENIKNYIFNTEQSFDSIEEFKNAMRG